MKSLLALVVLASLAAPRLASADEPSTVTLHDLLDEPGTPNENGENADAPVTTPNEDNADAPKKGPVKAPASARMTTPQAGRKLQPRSKDDGESRLKKEEDTVAGGKHFRIETAQGAVHVWVPPGYDRETAGTVIYVHGYWVDADGAWKDYHLAQQFKMSKQNALFIVPDAPSDNDEKVQWPALTDLRKALTRANIKMPDGPTIVMGHSGAFRTVMQWVDHRAVSQIILLDAMYAGEAAFDEFIKSGKRADDHKLIVVAASTATESSAFVKKYKFAVAREKFPSDVGGFTKAERRAKLLYVRSQFDHMSIVTGKKVIPVLLRVTPLKAL
jgi:hypothetical protein